MARWSRRVGGWGLGRAGLATALVLAVGCEQGQLARSGSSGDALTYEHVVTTGQVCAPTGKHDTHRSYACSACHQCAGTLSFDAAVAGPSAAFDANTKSCSSVACHAVPAGTFTYPVWDWGCDCQSYTTVSYGGAAGTGTPNWYAPAGASGCSACHGYAPTFNGTAYVWHSGMHGGTLTDGNTCQLCHPDVTGAYVAAGYAGTSGGLIASCTTGFCSAPGTITDPTRHGNGTVDVAPKWGSRCFGCH